MCELGIAALHRSSLPSLTIFKSLREGTVSTVVTYSLHLQRIISNHAAKQASNSRLKDDSTALALTSPRNALQPWRTENRQQQTAALPQHKVSQGVQGKTPPILAMLERLQLLQQEGIHLASFLEV